MDTNMSIKSGKKYFLILAGVLLIAAGCQKARTSTEAVKSNKPAQPDKSQNLPQGEKTGWKIYKSEKYGVEFQYPAQAYLTLNIINKDGSIAYYDSDYSDLAQRDSELDKLNQDIKESSGNSIMLLVYSIVGAFPKDLAEACKQNNMPVSEGKKCLNSGGDAGPGATQDFLLKEKNALETAEVGSDFYFFRSSPVQSEPFTGELKKITGTVIQYGSHKVYAYAVPNPQAPQLDLRVLAFSNSGNLIQIYYNPANFNSNHPDLSSYAKLKPADIVNTDDWVTIKKIAKSLRVVN